MFQRVFQVSEGSSLYLYLNLKLGTIQDWEHMVATFKTKFLFAEAKYTLVKLGRTWQYADEELDLYVKRFHDKALDCVYLVEEDVLLNVCLYGMKNEYMVFLENITFSSFSKLMKAAWQQTSQFEGLQSQVVYSQRRCHPRKESRR